VSEILLYLEDSNADLVSDTLSVATLKNKCSDVEVSRLVLHLRSVYQFIYLVETLVNKQK
jgi:hypothetical protein